MQMMRISMTTVHGQTQRDSGAQGAVKLKLKIKIKREDFHW